MTNTPKPKIIDAYCPRCYDRLNPHIVEPMKPRTYFVYVGEQETLIPGKTIHLYYCLECEGTFTIGTMVQKRFAIAEERGELVDLL